MKIQLVSAFLVLGLAGAAPAQAQVFGQYTGAEPLSVNTRLFGAYIHSSNNVVGLLGQLRLSFYPSVDFGFQGGISRHDLTGASSDSRTTVRLGADFKVRVASEDVGAPVTIAVGAALGVETGDNWSILSLGPTVVASHSFPVGSGGALTPYAGTGLLYSSIDVETLDDTDVSFPLRFGLDAQIASTLKLLVEMQIKVSDDFNDDSTLVAGVNLPF